MKTKKVQKSIGDCSRTRILSIAFSLTVLFAFFAPNTSVYAGCQNVTNGGTIAGCESYCGPFDPCLISSVCPASGGYGTLEYRWQYSTNNCQNWTCITNSNSACYNPGPITQTTYYRRQARRICCSSWTVNSNNIKKEVLPVPSATICANGPTTFCYGGSVVLSAPASCTSYLWSNGATSRCITVTCSGTYTVTVTNADECSASDSRCVNVIPLPQSCISGNGSICQGGSTCLCAPDGCSSYLWNNGSTSRCITVTCAGTYSVTVWNNSGCSSTSSKCVTVDPIPSSCISGDNSFCQGGSTVLSAPAGCATYLWSTGSTSRCITVYCAGTYTVTVTSAAGCSSSSSKCVTVLAAPTCLITGNTVISHGGSTQLKAPLGCNSYLWSTGATTRCITVHCAGTYCVTVTNANNCSKSCSVNVTWCGARDDNSLVSTVSNSSDAIESLVFPNPFNQTASFQFANNTTTRKTVVEIYGVNGAKICELFNDETEFGQQYIVNWDATAFPSGLYMYRITCGDQVTTGRIMHK